MSKRPLQPVAVSAPPRGALIAPFPYFGGKSRVAQLVWARLGQVKNYIEPFCGSAAMLLLAPQIAKTESINDRDCMLANFWRATQHEPDVVAAHANWPVNETDLHSRHRWLVMSPDAEAFRHRMLTTPNHYDARIAGWWVWGLSCWIGGEWCAPGMPSHRRPHLGGMGVHKHPSARTCDERLQFLVGWLGQLRDRLRNVRVTCGDWARTCTSRSATTARGLTGVFLDPPYAGSVGRTNNIYATEDLDVSERVRHWCIEHGDDPLMRIALCGYEGEHDALEREGWRVVAWKAPGGYGLMSKGKRTMGMENSARERIWFSPHCLAGESPRAKAKPMPAVMTHAVLMRSVA